MSGTEALTRRGYEVMAKISENRRSLSLKVRKDGKLFFAKRLSKPKELRQEVDFANELNALDNPNLPMQCPEMIEEFDLWYVAEYLEATPIARPIRARDEDLRPYAKLILSTLIELDKVKVSHANEPIYDDTESAPYTKLLTKVDGWMEKPLAEGIITQDRIDLAKELIEKYRLSVNPGWQHGDFVPWHILRTKDDRFYLVDGEHASRVKPRFYDLAYIYTRLSTRSEAVDFQARLLSDFVREVGEDQVWPGLLPVMTLRALGMHLDAANDFERKDSERIDYRDRAAKLLDLCFEDKLTAFLN